MARTAPVVLLAGGVEAAATRCLSSALVGQGCTGCAPGWWVGEGATKVSSSALLGQSSIGVLLAGGAEAVAMRCFLLLLFRARAALAAPLAGGMEAKATTAASFSVIQNQGGTGCAPDLWGGRSGDEMSSSPTIQGNTGCAPGSLLASGRAATGQWPCGKPCEEQGLSAKVTASPLRGCHRWYGV